MHPLFRAGEVSMFMMGVWAQDQYLRSPPPFEIGYMEFPVVTQDVWDTSQEKQVTMKGAWAELQYHIPAYLAEKEPEGATAKVTYRVTTNKDGETFETEQVQVRRPPDSRIEYSSTVDGEGTRSIVINAGGKMYNCFERGGEESCWVREIEATEAGAPFGTPRYLVERVEDIDLLDMSLRQIAGLDATCFAMTIATPNPHEEEHCFSNEGLLLYWQSEFELASVAWEATSVSNDVTDVDFEPPYEIVEVPDFEIPEP